MQVIVIRTNPSRRDDLIAELWERGTVGILENDLELRAYFPESMNLAGIVASENGEIIESLLEKESPTYQEHAPNNEPVCLGQRFVVLTESSTFVTDSSRIPLLLASSEAFGSGRHESTQLMVEVMEAYLQPGTVTLDVGCGSGILSKVAHHLGASTVVACDIHENAIMTARQTCRRSRRVRRKRRWDSIFCR